MRHSYNGGQSRRKRKLAGSRGARREGGAGTRRERERVWIGVGLCIVSVSRGRRLGLGREARRCQGRGGVEPGWSEASGQNSGAGMRLGDGGVQVGLKGQCWEQWRGGL